MIPLNRKSDVLNPANQYKRDKQLTIGNNAIFERFAWLLDALKSCCRELQNVGVRFECV